MSSGQPILPRIESRGKSTCRLIFYREGGFSAGDIEAAVEGYKIGNTPHFSSHRQQGSFDGNIREFFRDAFEGGNNGGGQGQLGPSFGFNASSGPVEKLQELGVEVFNYGAKEDVDGAATGNGER